MVLSIVKSHNTSMPNKRYTLIVVLNVVLLMSFTIDLDNLFSYATLSIPNYVDRDNSPLDNQISDSGATLGRVLFYDKALSIDFSISCSSCHRQEFAFGDTADVSIGVNGVTGRHSMRLVNARFSEESNFFWDERATSLEHQTTQPIQDHIEMGFSGNDGDPGIDSLLLRLASIDYYERLFELVYGDDLITEMRLQQALAQFVRSIQSYDSRFDQGLDAVRNMNQDFPNFTASENAGKTLYLSNDGGAGCQRCHRAPEFDIDPDSDNNGVVGVFSDPMAIDLNVTRAPSLRDLVNPEGLLNGALMHDASLQSLRAVIDHYDDITIINGNTNLYNRLRGGRGGNGANLNLTEEEKADLEAFLLTLTGSDMYTNEMWSDPFDEFGNLTLIPLMISNAEYVLSDDSIELGYDGDDSICVLQYESGSYEVSLYDRDQTAVDHFIIDSDTTLQINDLPTGPCFIEIINQNNELISLVNMVKAE